MSPRYLIFSNSNELLRLRSDRIVYVTSEGNYSTLHMENGDQHVLTMQLGMVIQHLENQLGADSTYFIRIGRSLIINRNYIHTINPAEQRLQMFDDMGHKHKLSASKEALRQLKDVIESGL